MQTSEDKNKWIIDKAHSSLEFAARHMMISNVRGRFNSFSGDVRLDIDDLASSSIKVEIDAISIYTNEEDRDKHLRSPDFLDVEKYPHIKFESAEIRKSGNQVEVDGKLTIRDVTNSVTIMGELQGPISDLYGKKRFGFDGAATIARKDYGLKWNMILEGGGLLVGESVKIDIHMELTQS